jgi:plasmid replication initiation protein
MNTLAGAKNKQLKQSNIITSSRYEFTLIEKRLVYLIIQVLNNIDEAEILKYNNVDGLKLTINYKPVLQVCELWSDQENQNYTYIKNAIKALRKREYDFENVKAEYEGNQVIVDEGFCIISQYRIIKGTTIAQIDVPKLALKYFSNLKGNFTNYNMFNAMTLTSQYSQRMYEQCSRFKDTKWFKLTLLQVRELLNIPASYNISNIRKLVLDVASKELTEKTELSFDYKEQKEGKKVVRFLFKITTKVNNLQDVETPVDALVKAEVKSMLNSLPLSEWQKQHILDSNKINNAKDLAALIYEYQTAKNTLNNPVGWLVKAFENKFGISFKNNH